MKIQSTLITETSADSTLIEILLSDSPDAETASGEFLRARLSIPSGPVPRVSVLQVIALRRMRLLIDERIREIQSLLSLNHVDIPQS